MNRRGGGGSDSFPEVDILLGAEVLGDGDAVEVLADLAVVDGGDVEEEDETDKDEHGGDEADPEEDQLSPAVIDAEGDEGHDGVGYEEAEDEAEEVGVVVNPRKESGEEEDRGDADQLEDGHLGVLEAGPLVDHLDDGGGKEAKVGARGSHLGSVRDEDGTGEVANHPRAQVDDPDPLGSCHLLQVSHQPVLKWEFKI